MSTGSNLEAAFYQLGFDKGLELGKEQSRAEVGRLGIELNEARSRAYSAEQKLVLLVETARALPDENPADFMRRVMALVAEHSQ